MDLEAFFAPASSTSARVIAATSRRFRSRVHPPSMCTCTTGILSPPSVSRNNVRQPGFRRPRTSHRLRGHLLNRHRRADAHRYRHRNIRFQQVEPYEWQDADPKGSPRDGTASDTYSPITPNA